MIDSPFRGTNYGLSLLIMGGMKTGITFVTAWFLGLIHPPVGMNVFVIKSVIDDVKISTIFKGVLPFVATDIVRLIILIAFPILATYLPSHMR